MFYKYYNYHSTTVHAGGLFQVFVALKNNDVVICGYTDLDSDTKHSCLASVRNFALKLNMQAVPDAVASPSLL
jgi:hypothetical protein